MTSGTSSIIEREFPATPLVGVGAIVVQNARVLLVRRGTEPLKGHWTLPGGMLEVGEALAAGVVREVREETGLDVEPIELIELLDRIHREHGRVRYHYVIAASLAASCAPLLTLPPSVGLSAPSGIATAPSSSTP
jgi:ADP-ribose pyrophosphatase YjhB (NUDIX family)